MPPPRAKAVLESVGANVVRLRTKRGWTQEELAERAEIEQRHLYRIERGRTDIGLTVLLAVAAALEVPVSRLLRPARLPPVTRGRPPTQRSRAARR